MTVPVQFTEKRLCVPWGAAAAAAAAAAAHSFVSSEGGRKGFSLPILAAIGTSTSVVLRLSFSPANGPGEVELLIVGSSTQLLSVHHILYCILKHIHFLVFKL